MFAYCNNNPVNMADYSGRWPQWFVDATNWINNHIVQPVVNSVKYVLSAKPQNLPPNGEPGSSQTSPNPDGTPKQKRWYGPDGPPPRDRDFNHPGNVPFPHNHEWKDGERSKDHQPPSPEYNFSWKPVLGIGLVTVCVIGMVVVVADDLTGVGIANDYLCGPLGAGIGKGMAMILG